MPARSSTTSVGTPTLPELAETALLLDEGSSGLVTVVVNRRGEAVMQLLRHARRSSSVDMLWGDLEEELCRDLATPLADTARLAS